MSNIKTYNVRVKREVYENHVVKAKTEEEALLNYESEGTMWSMYSETIKEEVWETGNQEEKLEEKEE